MCIALGTIMPKVDVMALNASREVDIAIVGGGLVGASLACALAPLIERHGVSVAVVEAAAMK